MAKAMPVKIPELLRLSNYSLAGKTAIVTGAGQGMGEAFAFILGLNGARVAVCDLNTKTARRVVEEMVTLDYEVAAYYCDVSKPEQVSSFIDEVTRELGPPDILINNAGVLEPTSFLEISESEWQSILKVNLDGVFHCCHYVAPLMVRRRYGKIINMSSTAGKSCSTFGGAHYTTSKAAVLGLTRHLAKELASFNITVNAVCPGSIDTPMIQQKATADQIQAGITKIPLGRLGTPEEVANLILFLSSDASSYITGASIDINGGELII
jgi:NAD(P)-dependent dehydrogenase (short-subunit alcohol dehydrogenase family)